MDEPVIYLELLPDDDYYDMENHVQVPLLNNQGMLGQLSINPQIYFIYFSSI